MAFTDDFFADTGEDPTDPLWTGYDPTQDTRYTAFNERAAANQPKTDARSVPEFLAAMRADWGILSPQEQQYVSEIERNPNDYEFKAGRLRKKGALGFIGNHPFLTLAGAGGAMAAPALFGGAGAGASGVLPSSSPHLAAATMAAPPAIASQGASLPGMAAALGANAAGGAAGAVGGGLGNTIGNVAKRALGGGNDGGGWLQALLAALTGLPAVFAASQGPSDEEKALMEQARQIQALQQGRIEHQNPLFEAVTQLAMNRMPTNTQMTLDPLARQAQPRG